MTTPLIYTVPVPDASGVGGTYFVGLVPAIGSGSSIVGGDTIGWVSVARMCVYRDS